MKSLKEQLAGYPFATVGDYSYASSVSIQTWRNMGWWDHETSKLSIGKFCSFAHSINIFMGGNHATHFVSTYPFPELWADTVPTPKYETSKGNINIGNDVWVGIGATIMSGVTIGDGAVIGAYAVVASNVEPYGIAVGNPARVVRKRFDEETIKKLLEIRWWDWDIQKIRANRNMLFSKNIETFVNSFVER
jgi:acetyltransferase-like isoleucine patch superfamily enzyme